MTAMLQRYAQVVKRLGFFAQRLTVSDGRSGPFAVPTGSAPWLRRQKDAREIFGL